MPAWPQTMTPLRSLAARCAGIELLILDVDGVLTDGRLFYGNGGGEPKTFHVRDGSAIKAWRQAGKHIAILTGRRAAAVAERAAELGIAVVRQGVGDKSVALDALLAEGGWLPEQVCAVGDDEPDCPLLARCGLAVAVGDGCSEARALAHYVTRTPGGQGAVREVIDLILRCQGQGAPSGAVAIGG